MDTIAELVDGVRDLVPLPKSYMRIQELVNDPDSSLDDVTKVIMNDSALTSRILRIANSAYMGLAAKVDTVGRAVQVLGLNQVHDLALAGAAVGSLTKIETATLDVGDFWRRSVYCAVVARIVSKQKKIGSPERLFVSGLLHDSGHLLLAHRLPDRYAAARAKAIATATPIHVVEQEEFGFNYAELGAALLRSWQLPEAIIEPVQKHADDLASIDTKLVPEACVLHVGAIICRAAVWRSEVDEPVPEFDPVALQLISIDSESTESIMHEADESVIEAMTLLLPAAGKSAARASAA
ncbi:MAG: HD-like signal output (HDOD) protein [Gammaproteobacteria bacterium]|jgi:HD-like signal output (HDOD) protein